MEIDKLQDLVFLKMEENESIIELSQNIREMMKELELICPRNVENILENNLLLALSLRIGLNHYMNLEKTKETYERLKKLKENCEKEKCNENRT